MHKLCSYESFYRYIRARTLANNSIIHKLTNFNQIYNSHKCSISEVFILRSSLGFLYMVHSSLVYVKTASRYVHEEVHAIKKKKKGQLWTFIKGIAKAGIRMGQEEASNLIWAWPEMFTPLPEYQDGITMPTMWLQLSDRGDLIVSCILSWYHDCLSKIRKLIKDKVIWTLITTVIPMHHN